MATFIYFQPHASYSPVRAIIVLLSGAFFEVPAAFIYLAWLSSGHHGAQSPTCGLSAVCRLVFSQQHQHHCRLGWLWQQYGADFSTKNGWKTLLRKASHLVFKINMPSPFQAQ